MAACGQLWRAVVCREQHEGLFPQTARLQGERDVADAVVQDARPATYATQRAPHDDDMRDSGLRLVGIGRWNRSHGMAHGLHARGAYTYVGATAHMQL